MSKKNFSDYVHKYIKKKSSFEKIADQILLNERDKIPNTVDGLAESLYSSNRFPNKSHAKFAIMKGIRKGKFKMDNIHKDKVTIS